MRLSAVEGEIGRLNSVLAMSQGELNTLGDPAATQATLEDARPSLPPGGRNMILTLALEGLDEANRAMQARFAPALNQRAGEIMERLTGGRYDRVTLTREFEALAERRRRACSPGGCSPFPGHGGPALPGGAPGGVRTGPPVRKRRPHGAGRRPCQL